MSADLEHELVGDATRETGRGTTDDLGDVITDLAPPDESSGRLVRLPTGRGAQRRRLVPRSIERLSGVVLLFAVWELASRRGWLSPKTLAAPSTVLKAGWHLVQNGTLSDALSASLVRVAWGLAIGVPAGAVLAVLAGITRVGDALIDRNVQMLRFVPVIGLQSVLILWLGIGEEVKISLIVIGVAFPIYVNTYLAIRRLDPRLHELADVLVLSRWARLRRIVLPGALPGFLVGFRLATAIAWLVLVFAEQLNARTGLGFLIVRAQTFFQSDVIVFCLVVYAVLGLVSDSLVRLIEKGVLRWQPGR